MRQHFCQVVKIFILIFLFLPTVGFCQWNQKQWQGRSALKAFLSQSKKQKIGQKVNKTLEYVPGEFLVKLKPYGLVRLTTSFLTTEEFKLRLSNYFQSEVKRIISDHNIVIVERPSFELVESSINYLRQFEEVEIVEPNFIYHALETPNDFEFTKLWGLHNVGQKNRYDQPGVVGIDINAERAWEIERGSGEVIVAVIDTGVDFNHNDLKENIWINDAEALGLPNFDDDGNGFIDDIYGMNFSNEKANNNPLDDNGHGTHCSGIIGAVGNNNLGVVGVNWKVKMMPIKFLSSGGSGTLEGAINSIDYAIKMKANIISASWGGMGSQLLKEAIDRSEQAGILFVAAAGNNSADVENSSQYPTNYDNSNIISVASINNRGELSDFSNYGKIHVHVAAPGEDIYSTVPENHYAEKSGTSMATPFVAGIAALLSSLEPHLSFSEIKQRLINTVRPLRKLRGRIFSSGLVDAYSALTNTLTPPDLEDPFYWEKKEVNIFSDHPYQKKIKFEYEIEIENAKEISLFFDRFETEAAYDVLKIYDKTGKLVEEISGSQNESYSSIIQGNYAKLVFIPDDSVELFGFIISKIAYR